VVASAVRKDAQRVATVEAFHVLRVAADEAPLAAQLAATVLQHARGGHVVSLNVKVGQPPEPREGRVRLEDGEDEAKLGRLLLGLGLLLCRRGRPSSCSLFSGSLF
jgi:hypothetical protein